MGPGMDSAELGSQLASRDMIKILEWAEEAFDHVIVDTPPALFMSEAKLLAPLVDGVIVVVGVGVSTLGMVRRCLRDMEQIGAVVLGVVLNGVRRTRGGYMRDNLALYYDYSKEHGNGKEDEDLPEIKIVEDEPTVVMIPYDKDPAAEEMKKTGDQEQA